MTDKTHRVEYTIELRADLLQELIEQCALDRVTAASAIEALIERWVQQRKQSRETHDA